MKKLLLLSMMLSLTYLIQAQTEDKKWNVGLHVGAIQYKGDLGNDYYKTDMALYSLGGLSISRYIGSHFDLSLFATKGAVGFNRPAGNFKSNFTAAMLNFRFNILGPRSAVRPYIFVGGGAMLFDKNLNLGEGRIDYVTPSFGGGVNFKIGPSVMLNLQETFMYTNEDKRDGVIAGDNDAYLMHTVGVTFNFGKKKDADKDGISDKYDKCPDTPPGIEVDKTGCPLDKDADGVADYLDECPDVAGVKSLKGCPDKDGDGVADKNDVCPDVAGPVVLKGCPDTDKDGIADRDDRCPDVAGPLELKGCPDTDKDGVADLDDRCPDTKAGFKVDAMGCPMDNDKDGLLNEDDRCPDAAGPASLKGCPDKDGDGVADIDDRCPEVKGTLINKGCPEMTKEDAKKITRIGSKIFFENDSDKLKAASLAQLDELVNILQRNEGANLFIGGHTDSNGSDEYNLTLSQKRTDAVKTYLMGKGIMESRLQAVGYGEGTPIADNGTKAGRAKNRRVELKTTY